MEWPLCVALSIDSERISIPLFSALFVCSSLRTRAGFLAAFILITHYKDLILVSRSQVSLSCSYPSKFINVPQDPLEVPVR